MPSVITWVLEYTTCWLYCRKKSLLICHSERSSTQKHQFEMLLSERDSDDGDAAQYSEEEVNKSYLPPPQKDPQHIHHNRKASGFTRLRFDIFSERPQSQSGQLQQLDSERNPDDGDAEQKADDDINAGNQSTSENKPKDVSQKTHIKTKKIRTFIEEYANIIFFRIFAEPNGVLAQLVERLNGIQKVRSSILLCSTKIPLRMV